MSGERAAKSRRLQIRGRQPSEIRFLTILICITIVGLVLRALCCFWGYPYQLHTDEPFVVDSAIQLLRMHMWEARIYFRPDQFEIKCDAILSFLFSRLLYHAGVGETFEEHRIVFHLVARFFTVFWGTLMIPVMSMFTGKLLQSDKMQAKYKRMAQLFAAGMTALFPVYVQHSAYATPDIPLASLTLLIAYLSLIYLESGNRKYFGAIAILTGVSITVKYPAAVMCVYIAFLAIFRAIRERDWKWVPKAACMSIGLILFTIFVIAPNMLTDIVNVVRTFMDVAEPEHIGADGLSYWGNLRYYLSELATGLGAASVPLFVSGLLFLALHRDFQRVGLGISALYWLSLSALNLHWQRWGTPIYISYIALVAIGGVWLLQLLAERKRALLRRGAAAAVALCIVLIGVNITASSLALTKWSLTPAACTESIEFCEENGITRENSIYEGYTPLMYPFGGFVWDRFELDGDTLRVEEKEASKRYLVISSTTQDSFFAEPERYAEQCAVYRAMDDTFEQIYKLEGEEYQNTAFELANIADKVKYLASPAKPTGGDVMIYDLQKRK